MKNTKRFIICALALVLSMGFSVNAAAWQYTVKSGDSMWRISQKNGISLNEMISANPQVKNPNLIYPGQVLEVPGSEASEYENEKAREILNLVNTYRAQNGLGALTLDPSASAAAQAKADDMAAKGYFSHTSPTYGTPAQMLASFGVRYSYMGENIAKGYTDPQTVMNGWMNSAGHRANILNPAFTKLGVGYNASANTWTQIFLG